VPAAPAARPLGGALRFGWGSAVGRPGGWSGSPAAFAESRRPAGARSGLAAPSLGSGRSLPRALPSWRVAVASWPAGGAWRPASWPCGAGLRGGVSSPGCGLAGTPLPNVGDSPVTAAVSAPGPWSAVDVSLTVWPSPGAGPAAVPSGAADSGASGDGDAANATVAGGRLVGFTMVTVGAGSGVRKSASGDAAMPATSGTRGCPGACQART
jgi:hypothetical protein